jgi:hypothetical protein
MQKLFVQIFHSKKQAFPSALRESVWQKQCVSKNHDRTEYPFRRRIRAPHATEIPSLGWYSRPKLISSDYWLYTSDRVSRDVWSFDQCVGALRVLLQCEVWTTSKGLFAGGGKKSSPKNWNEKKKKCRLDFRHWIKPQRGETSNEKRLL